MPGGRGSRPRASRCSLDGNVEARGAASSSPSGRSRSTHDGTRRRVRRRHRGRRALRAADQGHRHRRGPRRRRDRHRLRRGAGRWTAATSSSPGWTTRGGRSRCGGTRSARPAEGDVLVFQEADARFWTGWAPRRDDRWLMHRAAGPRLTTEIRLLDAATPLETPRVVAPRREGVEYDVEPAGDRLLIIHNTDNPDFDLARAPLDATSPEQWTPFVGVAAGGALRRRRGVRRRTSSCRCDGRADRAAGAAARRLPGRASAPPASSTFDEPLLLGGHGRQPRVPTRPRCRSSFESLVDPADHLRLRRRDRASCTLLKRQPVLGGYDPAAYEQRREWATAPDGTRVPISLVYRARGRAGRHRARAALRLRRLRDLLRPLLLRGPALACSTAGSSTRWRTCAAAARWAAAGTTTASWTARSTRSPTSSPAPTTSSRPAGSRRTGLWQKGVRPAACSSAPWSTWRPSGSARCTPPCRSSTRSPRSCDPTLPLTVRGVGGVGQPARTTPRSTATCAPTRRTRTSRAARVPGDPGDDEPATTPGCYSREPAKWVARLRETVTNDQVERPILLRTEMVAGHGGRSGRYDAWKQYAWEWAFLMDQVGAAEHPKTGQAAPCAASQTPATDPSKTHHSGTAGITLGEGRSRWRDRRCSEKTQQ